MVRLRLYHKNEVFTFSVCQRFPGVNHFLTTGGIEVDHLIKVASARFLHCKMTIFLIILFVANKYLQTLGNYANLIFPQTHRSLVSRIFNVALLLPL